ncbi:hypothetical protein [Xanthocytophaga agilis]|uniref:Uncharacterized protein n=1 Tax=Xanthocytophaga agilis TaxID=3048010 RepID=A0AAE3RA32_9BACT|nr:hypothetical protein [Xanthocytophaga agilis]MDJ1506000.1 hypothetical protein [Xanthocytophaga agilis]
MNTSNITPDSHDAKQLTVIDGTCYIWHKNAWKKYDKYRIKHRRKKFVRLVKRLVSGPIAGMAMGILTYRLLQVQLFVAISIALTIAAVGLYLRFRYVKYVYLGFIVTLYLFLFLRVLLR